jgi:hypothetical protein
VIAEINVRMPRTLGDSFIHISHIDACVETDRPLCEAPQGSPDAACERIGQHVAGLIPDGTTLQLGIGAIPDAELRCLGGSRHVPTDVALSSAELEDAYVALVRDVPARVHIPLALKISPFFTALPRLVARFAAAGANGLVLFNRFYQPDFDRDTLEVVPNLSLSTVAELRLPLR